MTSRAIRRVPARSGPEPGDPLPLYSATTYADAAQLRAVLERAPDGQRFIFASGAGLDPAHPTAALVRAECAAGRASQHLAGRDARGRLQHLVVKHDESPGGSPPLMSPAGSGAESSEVPGGPEPTSPEGRLLAYLSRLANLGLPRPSWAEMAASAQLRDRAGNDCREAARYRLKKLADAGHVVLHPGLDGGPGAITIAATGKRVREK